MTVSIKQAQVQLAELITRSAQGEEVVIANDGGEAVARIVAETGAAKGRVAVLDQIHSRPQRSRSAEEWDRIEQSFQQERNAWDR